MSRIMGMVRAQPVAAAEISARLALEPPEVTRHLQILAQQGMVRFNGTEVQPAVAA